MSFNKDFFNFVKDFFIKNFLFILWVLTTRFFQKESKKL